MSSQPTEIKIPSEYNIKKQLEAEYQRICSECDAARERWLSLKSSLPKNPAEAQEIAVYAAEERWEALMRQTKEYAERHFG